MSASNMDFHQVAAARAVARAVKAAERHGLVIALGVDGELFAVDKGEADVQMVAHNSIEVDSMNRYQVGKVF